MTPDGRRHGRQSLHRRMAFPSCSSGAPANGDQFLVQPTATAAGKLQVVLTNPSQIAAAGAIKTAAAGTNTGAATISSGTVLDPANPNLLTPGHHRLHEPDHLHHQRRPAQRLHQRRQHRCERLAGADQRRAGRRRYLYGHEQCRRHRRQSQCPDRRELSRMSACCKTAPPASPAA